MNRQLKRYRTNIHRKYSTRHTGVEDNLFLNSELRSSKDIECQNSLGAPFQACYQIGIIVHGAFDEMTSKLVSCFDLLHCLATIDVNLAQKYILNKIVTNFGFKSNNFHHVKHSLIIISYRFKWRCYRGSMW